MRKRAGFTDFELPRKGRVPEKVGPGLSRKRQPVRLDWKVKAPFVQRFLLQLGRTKRVEAALTELFFLDKYRPIFDIGGGTLIIGPGDPAPVSGADLVMLRLAAFSRTVATLLGGPGGIGGVVYVQFPVLQGVRYFLDVSVNSDQPFGYQLWEGAIFEGAGGGQGTDTSKFLGQGEAMQLDGHLLTAIRARHDGTAYLQLYASSAPTPAFGSSWDFFQCEVTAMGS
jgi:hypothetical protein